MIRAEGIERFEHRDLHRVAGWFIAIRWVASVCVPATLLIAQRVFFYPLAYRGLYATAVVLGMVNLGYTILYYLSGHGQWTESRYSRLFHVQILVDYLILLVLVYFSGFLENPFSYFFVFHVMLTSFIFPATVVWRYVIGLILVLAGAATAEYLEILPHFAFTGEAFLAYRTHMFPRGASLWATLTISAYLITSIRTRIEEKGLAVEIELNRYRTLDRVKSNFILQVTHELRGPIAAVSGFHEMILRGITGEVSGDTAAALRKADRRTNNLLTIIDEMIDYAYMRSDDENLYRLTPIDIGRLTSEIVDAQMAHAEEKEIALETECQAELVLASNRDLLTILMGNLINNAIKYSPNRTTIRVVVRNDGSDILLQVKDEGYGIESDQLEQIFEEFYRTRHARELERDGTGLGLPIVQRAVESLGGRITVYSELGRGTRFDVRLPVTGLPTGSASTQGESDEEDTDH